MYRVLIVDDEEPVLDGYDFMLKSTNGFTLCGKARSGYDALKLIYELKPDLVFMDINIPGMDGLEVIAEVHKKFASMVFILSTAYERFDLAQRAIPLGVFDYLVKPVSKKTFFAALEKVQEHLDSRISEFEQESIQEAGIQQYLRKTIWKTVSPDEWEQYRRRFIFPSGKGIVCIMELGEAAEVYGSAIMEKLSLRYHCRYDFTMNQGIYLVLGDVKREELEAYMETVLREIFPVEGYALGIGGLYHGSELHQSCAEAMEDLRRKRNGAQNRERLRIIQLRRKTGIAPGEETAQIFCDLWKDIFCTYDFSVAKAKMVSVFMFLMDDCSGCYSGRAEVSPPFGAAEEIMALPDIAAWEAWAAPAFEQIQRQATGRRSKSFPMPLVKAIKYVHDHYTETIQLPKIAEAANVSAAYLSRLFSEYLKTNFVDYVTELRIGQAEKLIRESSMNIKEIAFAVGYQDPNYFSKIFKKVTGLSPRTFGVSAEEPL
ncbi:DNA-binding response regulator [Spirochaetia bacterium]|nr:DNA-binding response regulator [Spirochaetia bacterium]